MPNISSHFPFLLCYHNSIFIFLFSFHFIFQHHLNYLTTQSAFPHMFLNLFLLANIFIICLSVPLESNLLPYPGFNRYQAQIVLPLSPPFSPILNASLPLSFNSGTPLNTIVALSQISWIGKALFSYTWSQPTSSQILIILDSFRTTNMTYHRLCTFKLNIATFEKARYIFEEGQFVYTQPSTVMVDQNIEITDHEKSSLAVLVGYQDRFDQSLYVNYQPHASYVLVNPYNKLTYTTLAINNYNIVMIKYKFYNVLVISLERLSSYYTAANIQRSSIDNFDSTINNNQAACPQGHFYGISSFITLNANNHQVSFRSYQFTALGMNGYLFSYYSCYLRCPLDYPYELNWQCFASCPTDRYAVLDVPGQYYKCQNCLPPCASCFGNPWNCTRCSLNFVLEDQYNSSSGLNRNCKCPGGQYGDPTISCTSCNATMSYCIFCTNGSYCLQCDISLVYNQLLNTCECPNGTIIRHITQNQNGIEVATTKIICISAILTESCNDSIVTQDPRPITGLTPFLLFCSCNTGGNYQDFQCQ